MHPALLVLNAITGSNGSARLHPPKRDLKPALPPLPPAAFRSIHTHSPTFSPVSLEQPAELTLNPQWRPLPQWMFPQNWRAFASGWTSTIASSCESKTNISASICKSKMRTPGADERSSADHEHTWNLAARYQGGRSGKFSDSGYGSQSTTPEHALDQSFIPTSSSNPSGSRNTSQASEQKDVAAVCLLFAAAVETPS